MGQQVGQELESLGFRSLQRSHSLVDRLVIEGGGAELVLDAVGKVVPSLFALREEVLSVNRR
ncbi:MAG TPA: hypothetical protein VLL25_07225 [Acidimicrobiales bacterium]|nr:hypothetical protein [Acidimicrobiales bacterium]